MSNKAFDKKIQVSIGEYTMLKRVYSISKKQAALMRILESEQQLASGKTKTATFSAFLKSL